MKILVWLFCSIFFFEIVCGELSAYPGSQNPPNGLIDPAGNIDFSELALSLINDFILMTQVFATCIPAATLMPAVPFFAKVSCTFNMLSVLSLLSLSILDGWDRLDESGPFKIQMRGLFENWAQNHTRATGKVVKRELPFSLLDPIAELCSHLDLHMDLYIKANTIKEHRLMCGSFEVHNSTFFSSKPFFQELCVSKEGVRRLGKNRFAQMPINTARKVAKFLIHGGLIQSILNPPLYLFNILQAYGEFADEITQKMLEITTIINSKTWDGHELGIVLEENNQLLLTITYKSIRV